MAVTAKVYGLSQTSLVNKTINYSSDTIKCMLLGSGYTPNQDTHQFQSDLGANEITGTGYTAGGVTLTSKTVTYDASTNNLKLDAADPTWTGAAFTAYYAVFVDTTPGTSATNPLLSYVDFGGAQTVSGPGTFTIVLDALGFYNMIAA